jgi:hypothetical protein
MDLERVSVPLEGWFGFIRADFRELFGKLFRVNLYVFGTALLAIVLGCGLLAGAMVMNAGVLSLLLGLLALAILVVLAVVARLFGLATYKVVDEEHGAKQAVDVVGVARQKAVPAILFGLILIAIYAVVLVAFGLIGVVVTIVGGLAVIVPFVQLGVMLTSVLVGFFLQFAPYELVLAHKGPIKCIRASIDLVKRNFWETIVFYILIAAVRWIVSIPFALVLVVAVFVAVALGILGGVTAAAIGGALALIVVGIVLLAVFLMSYLLAYSTTDQTVLFSLTYRYWRTIRGDMAGGNGPMAASTAAPAQTAAPSGGMPPSQSRAIMTTVQSPVMVAPEPGPMATMPPQKPAAQPMAKMPKPAAKKAPPKKPAPKRVNKKSS